MKTKGIVYYTNNVVDEKIFLACQAQLKRCMEIWKFPIVSVSQKPINFGQNFVMDKMESSVLSVYKQILKGLEECKTDVVFFAEHDVLYHPTHFDFTPEREDHFYYNRNEWHVSSETGKAVFYLHNNTTELSAFRKTIMAHIKRAIEANTDRFHASYGVAPPKGIPKEEQKGKHYGVYMSKVPNIDIRHPNTLSRSRMTKDEFRSESGRRGWTESDGVPGWGKTKGRFDEFISEYL